MEWKSVPGYEAYEVSDSGQVRRRGRLLRGSPGKNGYPVVHLRAPEGGRRAYVHQLVLEAFVGPRPDGAVACHADGTRTNNQVSNLRWDSQSANMGDARRHGTIGQKERCVNGHLRANNVYAASGACVTCVKDRVRARRARHRAAGLTSRGTVPVL